MSLDDVMAYVERRARVTYTPEGAALWMDAANKLLGGRSPRECVEAGEGEKVLAVLEAMESGAFV